MHTSLVLIIEVKQNENVTKEIHFNDTFSCTRDDRNC